MQVNMAHIRERSTAGGYIDFAVFEARSQSGSNSDNAALLQQLVVRAMSIRRHSPFSRMDGFSFSGRRTS
jgi:hypothetical protein